MPARVDAMTALDRLAVQIDLADKQAFAEASSRVIEALVADDLAVPIRSGGVMMTEAGRAALAAKRTL